MFYCLTILISMAVISAVNVFAVAPIYGYEFYEIIIWTTVCTISAIVIDGVCALVVRRLLPKRWFEGIKKGFVATPKESKFYQKIGIKKWKDKVIDLGVFTGFRKNKIYDPKNNEYLLRYILEANYGVVCHLVGVGLGVFCALCAPKNLWLTVGVPVAVVNLVLSTLPVFVLRYNLIKLHKLYRVNALLNKKKQ